MNTNVIQFNEPKPELFQPVVCSFCGLPTLNALSSEDSKKHICPKCMVKCAKLMKESTL